MFSWPDVETDVSIRFASGTTKNRPQRGPGPTSSNGRTGKAREEPPARQVPETQVARMIQHDMMMFDHGMPGPMARSVWCSGARRREFEFAGSSKLAAEAAQLAWHYGGPTTGTQRLPRGGGDRMSKPNSGAFQDLVPAIFPARERAAGPDRQRWDRIGTSHRCVSTFSDADFRLGLNAAQTTLSAVAQLAVCVQEVRCPG